MNNLEFTTFRDKIIEECCSISDSKSIEYTQSSNDEPEVEASGYYQLLHTNDSHIP